MTITFIFRSPSVCQIKYVWLTLACSPILTHKYLLFRGYDNFQSFHDGECLFTAAVTRLCILLEWLSTKTSKFLDRTVITHYELFISFHFNSFIWLWTCSKRIPQYSTLRKPSFKYKTVRGNLLAENTLRNGSCTNTVQQLRFLRSPRGTIKS